MQKFSLHDLRLVESDKSIEETMLLCRDDDLEMSTHPFRCEHMILSLCREGSIKIKINMREFEIIKNDFLIILPDQTIEITHKSDDFKAIYLILSPRFEEMLLSDDLRISILLAIKDNPIRQTKERTLLSYLDLYNIIERTIAIKNLEYKQEFIRHILLAFRYGVILNEMLEVEIKHKTTHEKIARAFLDLAHSHCSCERMLDFYAKHLEITSKHLSKVVFEVTGRSAKQWIDNYVVLEACHLLKNSQMTIQQISDTLNFPTQSFFGKYFKRHTGYSPSKYRELP